MTVPAIVFPSPDSDSAPQTLRTALSNFMVCLGSLPTSGIVIKVKDGAGGEELVSWSLAVPGLTDSLFAQKEEHPSQSEAAHPMTIHSVNFPDPDSDSAAQALRSALSSSAALGAFPKTGIILKVKEGQDGSEELVNWTLADPSLIEMIALMLSVAPK